MMTSLYNRMKLSSEHRHKVRLIFEIIDATNERTDLSSKTEDFKSIYLRGIVDV